MTLNESDVAQLVRTTVAALDLVVERIADRVVDRVLEQLPQALRPPDTSPAPQQTDRAKTQRTWMATSEVAKLSGRHSGSVLDALRRGLLKGSQRSAGATWRISPKAFEEWMGIGAPIDDPVKARLRRMA